MAARCGEQSERFLAAWGHRRRLIGLARSRGMSLAEAEDIVSNAVVAAALKADLDLDRCGAWLSVVVANACYTERHRRARFVELPDRPELSPGPEDTICDESHDRWILDRVTDLPPAQREALMARAQGYSVTQVADQVGRSYPATESLLSRARSMLRSIAALPAAWVAALLTRRGRRRAVLAGVSAVNAVVGGTLLLLPLIDRPPAGPVSESRLVGPEVGPAHLPWRVADPSAASLVRPVYGPRWDAAPGPPVLHIVPATHATQGPVSVHQGGVTQRHPEESLADSVRHCLERGVRIDPQAVGCPPD